MKHFANPAFWAAYHSLPLQTRELADSKYQLLRQDPRHPSLHLKKVGRHWSVRVGAHHRALGIETDSGDIVWFWIGTHAEYDHLTR